MAMDAIASKSRVHIATDAKVFVAIIGQAKCDKISHVRLAPMRQASTLSRDTITWVEAAESNVAAIAHGAIMNRLPRFFQSTYLADRIVCVTTLLPARRIRCGPDCKRASEFSR